MTDRRFATDQGAYQAVLLHNLLHIAILMGSITCKLLMSRAGVEPATLSLKVCFCRLTVLRPTAMTL